MLFKNTHYLVGISDIFRPNNNHPNNSFLALHIIELSTDKQKSHVDETHDNDFVVLPISPPVDLPLPPPEPPVKPTTTRTKPKSDERIDSLFSGYLKQTSKRKCDRPRSPFEGSTRRNLATQR